MGAYILRRILLIIPTLLGIMIVTFTLVQFVPGGPVEQMIANMQGEGDVFGGFAGGAGDSTITDGENQGNDQYGAQGLPRRQFPAWQGESSRHRLGIELQAVPPGDAFQTIQQRIGCRCRPSPFGAFR